MPLTVGLRPPHAFFESGAAALRAGMREIEASGIDRLCVGDHVSFHGGRGFDGLVQSSVLAALSDLEVQTTVYLLPLRHPVPVARQVNSLAQIAPGRFVFGVGIGGEDPAEVRMCGVDPTSRGRRMDESLVIVRGLLSGENVSFDGEFFQIADAQMLPVPSSPVPMVIGGRSEAALKRAGRLGDGWLALWTSPTRYVESIAQIQAYADSAGRRDVTWRHGLQVWCSFDSDPVSARRRLAATMEELYKVPFEKFERYSPYGSPSDVADALMPYVEVGCREINVIAVTERPQDATSAVAEMRELLLVASARFDNR